MELAGLLTADIEHDQSDRVMVIPGKMKSLSHSIDLSQTQVGAIDERDTIEDGDHR